jgi:protoporphyrin/coproporphyrin ferrochelatase
MPADLIGVLLMAYGTPERQEDLEGYYTDIRRGRPPTPEQLADLRRRYDAIGGLSPLAARTRAQAAGLQAALGDGFRVELGLKHAAPFIEDGARALADADCRRAVAVVLAPHYSALSVGQYLERAAIADERLEVAGVRSWHLHPTLIELLAERVREVWPADGSTTLLVTAHSLPERIRAMGDPYEQQLTDTAWMVAQAAGVERSQVAWQSAGRTPEPWIGPDILETIRALDTDAVVVCPAGFTSDHLEVLYDIDIEAKQVADEAGIELRRTRSLNDDPAFMELLAEVVRDRA